MRERTVVTAVGREGEREARRLVDLNSTHSVYAHWPELAEQLSKQSCAPLFLVLVCDASKLEEKYLSLYGMLSKLKKAGSLPPIVVLAPFQSSSSVPAQGSPQQIAEQMPQLIANDLSVETRGTKRALRPEEVSRGLAFARSGIANFLLPSNPDRIDLWSSHKGSGTALDVGWTDPTSYEKLVRTVSNSKALNNTVSADITREHKKRAVPATEQLQICLQLFEEKATIKDALELAMCVYTTYFYSKVNSSLRDFAASLKEEPRVRELVYATYHWLMAGFMAAPECLIRTFRMELRSGWMKNAEVGQTLDFPGFTSTHPELDGVNIMWANIKNGFFGKVDQPALLVFEGKFPVLTPKTKYFRQEVEYILPAGMRLEVAKKYTIKWTLTKSTPEEISVYHLKPTTIINKVPHLSPVQVLYKRPPIESTVSVNNRGTVWVDREDYLQWKPI